MRRVVPDFQIPGPSSAQPPYIAPVHLDSNVQLPNVPNAQIRFDCFVPLRRIDAIDNPIVRVDQGVPDAQIPGPSFARPAPPPVIVPPRKKHASVPKKASYGAGFISPNFDESTVQTYSLGRFNHVCPFCKALFFEKEGDNRVGIFSLCCSGGSVVLPTVKQPPPYLERLACGNDEDSQHFLENIRHFNNSFAMSCFKAEVPELRGQGPYVFRVHGQVYYGTGYCRANAETDPVFGQIYFLDSDDAVRRRLNIHREVRLREHVVQQLELLLRDVNPWVHGYLMMKEVIRENGCEEFAAVFGRNLQQTLRTLNLPVLNAGEVAAVIQSAPGGEFETSHVGGQEIPLIIYPRGGGAHQTVKLGNLNPTIDPTVYPLLFPYGDFGYETGIRLHPRVTFGRGRRRVMNGEPGIDNANDSVDDPAEFFADGEARGNSRRSTVSIREFYQFKIQQRLGEINLLHFMGKLYQQYLTDVMIRIDRNELWWYEQNQDKLRLDNYNNIREAVSREANTRGVPVGRIAILPSRHPGSPRYPQYNYMEAMSIVARHGKPCLFVTFTCNPQWEEFASVLRDTNQLFRNRPDLVNRVFYAKFLEILDDFVEKQLFGHVLNYVYSIEFQKRGLPHAHILFTFLGEDRVTTPDMIDRLVCAEIPDRARQPRLFAAVVKHMFHGKCGNENPRAACMKDNACSKFFPKDFCDESVMVCRNGRPRYRRVDNGLRVTSRDGKVYDNRWVVPYNPYLLLKYDCHINVEVCATLKSIKYLNKYINKGHDEIFVSIYPEGVLENNGVLNYNEIVGYERRRYVSSWEASWRIMNFPLAGRSHHVEHLPVHLPNEHNVTFRVGEEIDVLNRDNVEVSKLTAWFALNRDETVVHNYGPARISTTVKSISRDILYPRIPETFRWDSASKKWVLRKKRVRSIGLLADVPLRELELFHLRLLLLNFPGATSWENLRTVEEVILDSFTEACRARHLIENRNEYFLCMGHAAVYKRPHALRRLFAHILLIAPADGEYDFPLILATFISAMSEDLVKSKRFPNPSLAKAEALHLINDIVFRNSGKTLSDFHLDLPDRPIQIAPHRINCYDLVIPSQDVHVSNLDRLTTEQRNVFDAVTAAISRANSEDNAHAGPSTAVDQAPVHFPANVFFVDGPGGTGKTYLFSVILDHLLIQGKSFICMAWTGIAALLLKGGRTVHKSFSLQRSSDVHSVTSVCLRFQSKEAEEIKRASLIILDEASMVNVSALEAIDKFLRTLMQKPNVPMGGKPISMGGDFRQVLPVVPNRGPREIMAATIKSSHVWNRCVKFALTRNLRLRAGEEEWAEYLIQIGDDVVQKFKPRAALESLVKFPPNLLVKSVEDLIRFTFGNDILSEDNSRAAILCPTNEAANEINEAILDRLPGDAITFFSNNALKDNQSGFAVPPEVLNSVVSPSLPPHKLSLKVGSLVILLRNLDLHNGLCNGTRLRVIGIRENCLRVTILTGSHAGEDIFLPRMKIFADRDRGIPLPMIREQFPVRMSYAMTINKAQGQTLSRVGIYLKTPCFTHGQLYVALSRVQRRNDVRLLITNIVGRQGYFGFRDGHRLTSNVVFREILGDYQRSSIINAPPPVVIEEDAADIERITYFEDEIVAGEEENAAV